MIITNGRRLAIAPEPLVLQFDDQRRLMGLGAPGYGKRMQERKIVRIICTNHGRQI
jgi:hypothetical protein